ncbi:MAG: ribbon-helix-helix protein, CopG family [Lachnospiraceae bacterium]|nr:ribbon-helix-helix protein, CopG family [Lachnospiraceae bacterium]
MVQFNPQKEEKEVISLRISTNMIKELDEKANLFEISRNELIIQSIRFALDNISKETIKNKKAE